LNTALLIVDIQNDYFPGGKMELVGSNDAATIALGLLSAFRNTNRPVIHVQHISAKPGASFFLPNTCGVEINDLVKPFENETVIQKNFPNSFRNTSLLEYLNRKKINRLVICGMMTHMCIDATTRAAFDYGFDCIIAENACATRNLMLNDEIVSARYVHLAFLSALNSIYASVINTDEIIREYMK
jgi:nicotinamidase-related amidase